ncbi:hypothetical protein [Flavobacterium helocola]|uniref:Uncharacterized protein n=1 Tax=Flavobacterium helocola TaxID=3139139 RepID=A0ABU9IA03_9FLAO
MNQTLKNLIDEGKQITFEANCKNSGHGIYSNATEHLLSWVSRVEDYIRHNYNEESGPYKLFETFNRRKLTGYEKRDFEEQIKILLGALKSCETISPNKITKTEDNVIISLLKNYLFWTVLVVAVGGSYKLGFDNGNSRFDKDNIEMSKENEILKSEIKQMEIKDLKKDSIIIELQTNLNIEKKK